MSDFEFSYKLWLIVSQVLTFLGVVFLIAITLSRISFKVSQLIAAYFQAHCSYLEAGRAARKAKLDEVLPKAEPKGRAKMLNEALQAEKAMAAKAMADDRQTQLEQVFASPPKGWSVSK
jgi:hypothetical protein